MTVTVGAGAVGAGAVGAGAVGAGAVGAGAVGAGAVGAGAGGGVVEGIVTISGWAPRARQTRVKVTVPAVPVSACTGDCASQPAPVASVTSTPALGVARTTPSSSTIWEETRTRRLVRAPTNGGSGAMAVSTAKIRKRSRTSAVSAVRPDSRKRI
jgi:hypothetical protein